MDPARIQIPFSLPEFLDFIFFWGREGKTFICLGPGPVGKWAFATPLPKKEEPHGYKSKFNHQDGPQVLVLISTSQGKPFRGYPILDPQPGTEREGAARSLPGLVRAGLLPLCPEFFRSAALVLEAMAAPGFRRLVLC